MKKYYLLFLSLTTVVFIFFAVVNFNIFKISGINSAESTFYPNFEKNNKSENFNNSGSFEIKNEIIAAIKKVKPIIFDKNIKAGIISHHLPTALPLIAEFYSNLKFVNENIKTFIIIGPDHYERCDYKAATTDIDYNTPFGILPIETQGSKIFLDNGIKVDNDCFANEHSIGAQTIFIKYLFPEAQIIPIIFSSAAGKQDLDKVSEIIKKINNAFIIGSLDFSHYQKLDMAQVYDGESRNWIEKNQPGKFDLKHIDSTPTIKIILKFANDKNLKPLILKRINSFAYTGQAENTTGYMSIFFE